ncbi:6543_t:CDS:1, partial [Racocetra persica]
NKETSIFLNMAESFTTLNESQTWLKVSQHQGITNTAESFTTSTGIN